MDRKTHRELAKLVSHVATASLAHRKHADGLAKARQYLPDDHYTRSLDTVNAAIENDLAISAQLALIAQMLDAVLIAAYDATLIDIETGNVLSARLQKDIIN